MSDNNYLGIPEERKPDIQDFIELSADLDFWHDFNGDKMDARFFNEIATSYQITPNSKPDDKVVFVENVRKLQKNIIYRGGETFWSFFSKEAPISTILPSESFFGRMGADEDKIIDDFIWQQYDEQSSKSLAALKVKIKDAYDPKKSTVPDVIKDKVKIRIGPKIIKSMGTISDNTKTPLNDYDITCFPNRYQGNKLSPIIPLLEISEENTENFLLLIDVTLLSISSIKKNFMKDVGTKYRSDKIYNIYIISSLENESDPAGKIGAVDQTITPKDREEVPEMTMYTNIKVFFLEEDEPSYNSNFPDWTNHDKNSLLYSKCQLRTYRNPNGKIGCQVRLPNNTTVDHKDLGVVSEIRAAGDAMVRKYCEYNLKPSLGQQSEISHYYLLKRAGDWCQALCLLDRDRVYKVKDEKYKNIPGKQFSLNQFLKTNANTEIALMTHDRVLLSYALQMGLNVMFSVLFNIGGGIKTIVQIYFKNQKAKNPEFQWLMLLNQINSILSKMRLDTYDVPELGDSTDAYIELLKNMILEGADKIDIEAINAEIAESNASNDNVKTKLRENIGLFETELDRYLGHLRLLLFVGSHIEKDILLIEKTDKPDIFAYISTISKTLDKLENNRNLAVLIDHLDDVLEGSDIFQRPAHIIDEYKCIQKLSQLVKERANFISAFSSSGIQRDWINFESTVLRQIEYDYKSLVNITVDDILPQRAIYNNKTKYKGLALFWDKMYDVFTRTVKNKSMVGGGPYDNKLTMMLLDRKINTKPLNILRAPTDGAELKRDIENVYGKNLRLQDIAKSLYTQKQFTLAEPLLTDYCNDFINYIVINDLVNSIANPEDLKSAVEKFDAEGLYAPIDKIYIERGTKLVDIEDHYNTVVDDYIIDSSNADGFEYFYKNLRSVNFENPANYGILIYRFLIYYLDRLAEKVIRYKVSTNDDEKSVAYEDSGYQHLIRELYVIDKLISDDEKNLLTQLPALMTLYYNPLEIKIETITPVKPKAGESNFYYNSLNDEDINKAISGLELDIKGKLIICIFRYYTVVGYNNLNTQLLESLIYNLCNEDKRTVINILRLLITKKLVVNDLWNSAILQAAVVVYLILSGRDEVDPIVDLNKLINIDAKQASILYARAIRISSNERLGPLIQKAAQYIKSTTVISDIDESDLQNLLVAWAYLNRGNDLLKQLIAKVNRLSLTQTAIMPCFMEVLGNFIKICNILEPDVAKANGYYIFIDKPIQMVGTDGQVKILVDDFNLIINNLLRDNNIDMRANFEDLQVGGGARKTMKRNYKSRR